MLSVRKNAKTFIVRCDRQLMPVYKKLKISDRMMLNTAKSFLNLLTMAEFMLSKNY
ncbi:Uncharacterized protein dnm_059250 [Desulfonema magnum]|uniref:Uncharacterized protein n=1 Tax=Desulfonema magnum TaxID=45655 RepID=A0A975BR55_9BACT|nr:Uncharacterized protein dnm_059250 [Desulfonema magnum]